MRKLMLDADAILGLVTASFTMKGADHQAILRVLRYSRQPPRLLFNYDADTTRPWRESQQDVLAEGFPRYETVYPDPDDAADGLIVTTPSPRP